GARGTGQKPREVARAIADHGQRFLGERGDDQLALLAVRERRAAARIDDLGEEVVLPEGEAVLSLDALGGDAGPDDLGQAGEIERRERGFSLDGSPELVGPGLGAEHADA